MEILIINNAAQYEEHYYYDKKYITDYPESYPCLLVKEHYDGGLMGGGCRHSHVFLNDPTMNFHDWYCGFVAGMKFQKCD